MHVSIFRGQNPSNIKPKENKRIEIIKLRLEIRTNKAIVISRNLYKHVYLFISHTYAVEMKKCPIILNRFMINHWCE